MSSRKHDKRCLEIDMEIRKQGDLMGSSLFSYTSESGKAEIPRPGVSSLPLNAPFMFLIVMHVPSLFRFWILILNFLIVYACSFALQFVASSSYLVP